MYVQRSLISRLALRPKRACRGRYSKSPRPTNQPDRPRPKTDRPMATQGPQRQSTPSNAAPRLAPVRARSRTRQDKTRRVSVRTSLVPLEKPSRQPFSVFAVSGTDGLAWNTALTRRPTQPHQTLAAVGRLMHGEWAGEGGRLVLTGQVALMQQLFLNLCATNSIRFDCPLPTAALPRGPPPLCHTHLQVSLESVMGGGSQNEEKKVEAQSTQVVEVLALGVLGGWC